jgi:hypothetical protein
MKLIRTFNLIIFFLIIINSSLFSNKNFGFIYKSIRENNTYSRHLLGPVYNYRKDNKEKNVKLLFYSKYENKKTDKTKYHFLYPILRYTTNSESKNFYLTPIFSFKSAIFSRNDRTETAFNSMLFPILFFGKDRNDNYSYGFLPLYGNLRRFLGKDEFHFVAFPFYLRTLYNDEEIFHFLFPVLAYSKSDSLSLKRFFPFYGKMKRPDLYERKFYLYPFYQEKTIYHNKNEYTSRIFFPFYGKEKYPDATYKSYLYPIFRYKENDIKNNISLFPVFIRETSSAKKRRFYSAFYGFTKNLHTSEVSGYYLLPFGYFQTGKTSTYDYSNYYLLPILRYYKNTFNDDKQISNFQLFPLFKISVNNNEKKIIIPSFDIFLKTSYIEKDYSRWWEIIRFSKSDVHIKFNFLWSMIEYENNFEKDKKTYGLNPLFNVKRIGDKKIYNFIFNLITREKKYDSSD